MITELIVEPFFALANFIIGLFPVIDLPTAMVGYLTQAFGLVRGLGIFIPVDTFFIVIGITFTIYVLEFFISSTSWFVRKIPTVS